MIIAIVGIDGSGKTTQARLLTERLSKLGYNCICINPVFYLFELMKMGFNNPLISPRKKRVSRTKTNGQISFMITVLGYFYVLLSLLAIKVRFIGRVVVCDRFFFQFLYDVGGSKGEQLVSLIPKPDFIFYLKGSWEIFRGRVQNEFDATVDGEYYVKVVNFLNILSQRYHFVEVDATLGIRQTSNFIMDYVKQRLGAK